MMETINPIQPLEERKEEIRENVEKRRSENFLSRTVREVKTIFQGAEGFIGPRDMALFKAAGYGDKEISWIAEVKKASDEIVTNHLNAYDLVRIQAMLARDYSRAQKESPEDLSRVSHETEKYLDEVLSEIYSEYEPYEESYRSGVAHGAKRDRYMESVLQLIDIYKNANTSRERAKVLTLWLGLMHTGGSHHVLEKFGGYPMRPGSATFKEAQEDEFDFLDKLDKLGRTV